MSAERIIIGAIGIIFLWFPAAIAQAQDNEPIQTKTISVCPFRIAEAGRTASFGFNFLYSLEVQANGAVSKVVELSSSQRKMKSKFVHDELFVECMNKWRLEPKGRYYVSFYVGTTSIGTNEGLPFNYMRIMDPDKQAVIIELPWSEKDLLKIISHGSISCVFAEVI